MASPKVQILMLTYNHEPFIAQAIEGVMMQKTNFIYELVVAEDYSTDGTRAVCIKYKALYPDKITLLINDVNIGAIANAMKILDYSTAKYIALCEGDDYWTDSLKLQKQVDFLDTNPNYILCGTDAKILIEDTGLYVNDSMLTGIKKNDFEFIDMAIKNRVITASVLFRNHEVLRNLPPWFISSPVGDWPLFLILSQFGRVKNFNFIGVTYRKHSGGIYSNATSYKINNDVVSLYKTFIKEFNLKDRRVLNNYKQYIFWTFLDSPDKTIQKKMILNYIKPFDFTLFFDLNFIKMVFKYFKY